MTKFVQRLEQYSRVMLRVGIGCALKVGELVKGNIQGVPRVFLVNAVFHNFWKPLPLSHEI